MNFIKEFLYEKTVSACFLTMAFPFTVAFKTFPVLGGTVWRFLLLTSTVDSPRVIMLFCGIVDGKDVQT